MAVRKILKMGESSLLQIAQPVDVHGIQSIEIKAIIQDLVDTMKSANGAGLAAPQIGVDLQIVVFGFDHNPRYPKAQPIPLTVLINPKITPLTDELEEGWEGCLSVPGLRGLVPRWQSIRYQAYNEKSEMVDERVSGFHARVVQHECDHLEGHLYPMRMKDLTKFGFTEVLFPEI